MRVDMKIQIELTPCHWSRNNETRANRYFIVLTNAITEREHGKPSDAAVAPKGEARRPRDPKVPPCQSKTVRGPAAPEMTRAVADFHGSVSSLPISLSRSNARSSSGGPVRRPSLYDTRLAARTTYAGSAGKKCRTFAKCDSRTSARPDLVRAF